MAREYCVKGLDALFGILKRSWYIFMLLDLIAKIASLTLTMLHRQIGVTGTLALSQNFSTTVSYLKYLTTQKHNQNYYMHKIEKIDGMDKKRRQRNLSELKLEMPLCYSICQG